MRGSREISLVPSLHRASTDALICRFFLCLMYDKQINKEVGKKYDDVAVYCRTKHKIKLFITAVLRTPD